MSPGRHLSLVCLLALSAQIGLAADAPKSGKDEIKKEAKISFSRDIQPIFAKFCVTCHGGAKRKGHLALDSFKDEESILKNPEVLDKIQEKIRAREMPPENKPQPDRDERKLLTTWIDAK